MSDLNTRLQNQSDPPGGGAASEPAEPSGSMKLQPDLQQLHLRKNWTLHVSGWPSQSKGQNLIEQLRPDLQGSELLQADVKRFREPAGVRRPWRIWFFDTSKQAIGALFIHFANVFLSTLTEEDPCSLYLMNFLLDATLGMLVIWAAVKLVSRLVEIKQWSLLSFGEYGDPPQAAAWLGQGGVYLLIMVLEKGVISLVLPRLQEVLLRYMANPQLALVMLIVPFVVNAIMFWVVDSLTMRKNKSLMDLEHSGDAKQKAEAPPAGGSSEEAQVLLAESDSGEEEEEDEEQRVGCSGWVAV